MKYYISFRCDTDGCFTVRKYDCTIYKKFSFHNKALFLFVKKLLDRNNYVPTDIDIFYYVFEFDKLSNNFRLCMFRHNGQIMPVAILATSPTITNFLRLIVYSKFYTVKTITVNERLDMIWLEDTFTDKDILFKTIKNDNWSKLSNEVLEKCDRIRLFLKD